MFKYGVLLKDERTGLNVRLMSVSPWGFPAFSDYNPEWRRQMRRAYVMDRVFNDIDYKFKDTDDLDMLSEFNVHDSIAGDILYSIPLNDLWDKHKIPFLRKLPLKALSYECRRIVYLINDQELQYFGHPFRAELVALDPEYERRNIPYYEPPPLEAWTFYEASGNLMTGKKYKTVIHIYEEYFKMPKDRIDVVSYEEFIKNEDERIPIFITMRGAGNTGPDMRQLPGFDDEDRLVSVIHSNYGKEQGIGSLHVVSRDYFQNNLPLRGFIRLH